MTAAAGTGAAARGLLSLLPWRLVVLPCMASGVAGLAVHMAVLWAVSGVHAWVRRQRSCMAMVRMQSTLLPERWLMVMAAIKPTLLRLRQVMAGWDVMA